jgi:hypothetical protein
MNKEIIEAFKALPAKERLSTYKALGAAINEDGDRMSSGRPESTEAYELILSNLPEFNNHSDSKIMSGDSHVKGEAKIVNEGAGEPKSANETKPE